jgi:hypothetical protein
MGHCGVTSVGGGDGELFKSEQGSNPPVWVNQYPCPRLALMPLDVNPLSSKFDIDFRIHPK